MPIKYAKIIDAEKRMVSVGTGTNMAFYKSIGMSEMEVEQGHDGNWYEKGHAPQRPLEEAKTTKLAELSVKFEAASKKAHCLSSAGFEINADETANRNIEGLTLVLKPGESTLFRAYDNRFHEVTKEQLETMRKEIVVHSQRMYQQKWDYEKLIDSATTVDELDAIHISFDEVNDGKEKVHGQTV